MPGTRRCSRSIAAESRRRSRRARRSGRCGGGARSCRRAGGSPRRWRRAARSGSRRSTRAAIRRPASVSAVSSRTRAALRLALAQERVALEIGGDAENGQHLYSFELAFIDMQLANIIAGIRIGSAARWASSCYGHWGPPMIAVPDQRRRRGGIRAPGPDRRDRRARSTPAASRRSASTPTTATRSATAGAHPLPPQLDAAAVRRRTSATK